jgi:hypothetical protein
MKKWIIAGLLILVMIVVAWEAPKVKPCWYETGCVVHEIPFR